MDIMCIFISFCLSLSIEKAPGRFSVSLEHICTYIEDTKQFCHQKENNPGRSTNMKGEMKRNEKVK